MSHEDECVFESCEDCSEELLQIADRLLRVSRTMHLGCDTTCLIAAGVAFDSAHAIKKALVDFERNRHDEDKGEDKGGRDEKPRPRKTGAVR